VGSPKGKRPLGRPRRRWEDNNKIGVQEAEWGGMDWIGLAQGRKKLVAGICEHVNEPPGSITCGEFLD
jgi:hypothetical protein